MTTDDFIDWLRSDDSIRVALVEVTARVGTLETVFYLSNRNYVTGATDTPPNTAYLPCIHGGMEFTESLSPTGQASVSYGDIEIANADSERDGWLDYVWDNRSIQVYIGDVRWPRADFRLVFDGVVGGMVSRAPEVLNLTLLDKLQRLNNPLSETKLGGTTNNKDRLIPLLFGECSNVQPLLINPATLQYQVHGGKIEDIIEVRDNGAPVSVTKSLTTGTFTLNQAPAGVITASVQGDKPVSYSNKISATIQRMATGYGPANSRLTTADLDTANLAAFATAHNQPIGYYAAERVNVLAACREVAASVGASVVMSTLGLLRLVQLTLPPPGVPTVVTAADMIYHSLQVADRPPVRAACKLGFCKNWTVQQSGLAGGLPASSAVLFQEEWLTTTSSDATVASIYKLDAEPAQEDTCLIVDADADIEVARRRDLWKTPRAVIAAEYKAHLLLTELGDAITIVHERFGLAAGKTGMVVQISRSWLRGRIKLGVLV